MVEDPHQRHGFVERHDRTLRQTFAETAGDFLRLVVIAIARQGQFDALFARPGFERGAFALPPRRVNDNRPFATDDTSLVWSRGADSTGEIGDGTAAIAEYDARLLVNAGLAEVRSRDNLRWLPYASNKPR